MKAFVALFLTLLFAYETGGASGGEVSLAVSTKKNIMELRVGGKTLRRYDVSVGTKSHPTPHGTFRINHIVWNPAWVPPKEKWAKGKKPTPPGDAKNPMKVVKIFFKEPDYYIHGTSHEGALGGAASHGCIRMSQSDAFRLGRYLMDNGGAARSDAWYANVFNRGTSADVRLKASAKIVIGP
ncbi:MAG TPA: L,D-transpeptidase [Thermoanaerobaculia bacterium]|nr:L,D-transpeptidase [Thermoanaerobaculia bacterium]